MDTHLQQYLNGFLVLVSIAVGAILTSLVLPTTGEAVNMGSILLWTAVSASLLGGSVYVVCLRRPPRAPTPDATR